MRIALNLGVGITALLLAFLGIRWMFAPEAMAAEQGIVLDGLPALSLARADLGGFFLGSALLCVLGLRPGQSLLLNTVAVLVGAIAVGRTIGLVADGFDANMAVLIGIEIVMVAVLVLAARQGAPASAEG
jgi:hypothetical protein